MRDEVIEEVDRHSQKRQDDPGEVCARAAQYIDFGKACPRNSQASGALQGVRERHAQASPVWAHGAHKKWSLARVRVQLLCQLVGSRAGRSQDDGSTWRLAVEDPALYSLDMCHLQD